MKKFNKNQFDYDLEDQELEDYFYDNQSKQKMKRHKVAHTKSKEKNNWRKEKKASLKNMKYTDEY